MFMGSLLIAHLILFGSIALWFGIEQWFGIIANVGDASEYLPQSLLAIPIFTFHMPFYGILIALLTPFLPPAGAALVVNMINVLGFGAVAYALSERAWVALFASFFPYFVFKYSMYVYADIPTLFFAAMSFYYLYRNRSVLGILFGSLAVATHYLALLLIPGFVCYMYRKRARFAPVGLIPTAPAFGLSVFRLFNNGDLFFYVRLNLRMWTGLGGGQFGFLSYPFSSVMYVFTHLSTLFVKWLPVNIFYSFVVFLPVYALYWSGAYVAYRKSAYFELAWSLPTILFVTCLSPVGFYYVPRYVILAFPLLLGVARFVERNRVLRILLILITIGSVAFAVGGLFSFPLART